MKKENCRLVQTTLTAKYLPNFIVALLLSLVFIVVGNIIGHGAYSLVRDDIYRLQFNTAYLDSIANMLYLSLLFGGVLLLTFLWIRLAEKRKFYTVGLYKDHAVGQYFSGFAIGALVFSFIMLILFVSEQAQFVPANGSYFYKENLIGVIIVILGWAVQSGTEEIVTRGWLMNVITARYNMPFGLIVSSGIFAVIHLFNPNVSLIAIINIILFGLFAGVVAIKTENVWSACGMHTAWNWVQGNIYGTAVSGTSLVGDGIFKTELIGSDLITGGKFGPEAGLVTTIVLFIAVIVVSILIFCCKKQNNASY